MGTTNALFRLTLFQQSAEFTVFASFQKNKTKAMAVDVARRGRKQQCYAACDWWTMNSFIFARKSKMHVLYLPLYCSVCMYHA